MAVNPLGLWWRFKRWLRRRVLGFVWRIVSPRIYRSLRSLVSSCVVPVATTAACVALGAAIAVSAAFSIGYGVLIGVGSAFVILLSRKLWNKVHRRFEASNSNRENGFLSNKQERTSYFTPASRSRPVVR